MNVKNLLCHTAENGNDITEPLQQGGVGKGTKHRL